MEKTKRKTGGIVMTLDEAIEHCKENVQKETQNGNLQCAIQHNQLAIWLSQIEESKAKAAAYDRIMSGGQKTPKEIANIFGFPIAMDCYSSNHEFQHGSDWNWFTTKPFIDGENDCWTIKRGQWGRVPYGLLNGYDGEWQESLTFPDRQNGMKHTKEPWVAEKTLQGRDSSISNRRGKTIAIAYKNENIDGDDLANAKRIALCVNACEGITDAVIEEGIIKKALIAYLGSYDENITWKGMKVWEDV